MREINVDVAVIGGGISGLSVRTCLFTQEEWIECCCPRSPGSCRRTTYTVKHPTHGSVDVGGAYIGPTLNRVYRLIKELGLQVYDGSWSAFKGRLPTLRNPFSYLDQNNAVRTIDKMAKQVPPDAPWKAPKAKEWDSITVQEFMESIGWTREVKRIMKIIINSVYTCEDHQMSLLYFLQYINSGHGYDRVTRVIGGAQEKTVVVGTQQLF